MKLRIINNYQQQLFPYAYNILGSVDDAMDAIQEVITKYLVNTNQEIENELGYLIKGVINQSINIKKRNQKKVDDKIWLPEPIAPESSDANINREEIISYSMLVMLEKLNPKERAVFILKEAFDYSHEEIAKALTFSIQNSRKILSRAKKTLANTNLAIKPSTAPDPLFLQRYISLIKEGNVQELEKTLSHDMMVKTDGGSVSIVNELTIGLRDSME
ncbi:MAG: sigma-70 family RNA polymerase sigma factor, partial [Sphingobacterium sp.]